MDVKFVNRKGSLVLLLQLVLVGCGGGSGSETERGGAPGVTPVAAVPRPVQTEDGWLTASPAEVGINEQPLIEAVNRIRRGDFNEIHSLLIVRNGQLVLEEYGSGRMYDRNSVRPDHLGPAITFHRGRKHIVHSVSKSFMILNKIFDKFCLTFFNRNM